MYFTNLHHQSTPLLLANVWDVPSALTAEALGFQAIGTSSSAISQLLGYEDGENMTFSELEFIVKRIVSSTKLPLSVDIEAGYSRNFETLLFNIKRLYDIGVVGINIEDSLASEHRTLVSTHEFASSLLYITENLKSLSMDMFVNVRTDCFLLNVPNKIDEAKQRITAYEKAGANGIFIPCAVNEDDILEIVNFSSLPVNVMCMPELSDFNQLKNLGVKRISMGNFLFDKMYKEYKINLKAVLDNQSFKSITSC